MDSFSRLTTMYNVSRIARVTVRWMARTLASYTISIANQVDPRSCRHGVLCFWLPSASTDAAANASAAIRIFHSNACFRILAW